MTLNCINKVSTCVKRPKHNTLVINKIIRQVKTTREPVVLLSLKATRKNRLNVMFKRFFDGSGRRT